jgi:hypothetical protein
MREVTAPNGLTLPDATDIEAVFIGVAAAFCGASKCADAIK